MGTREQSGNEHGGAPALAQSSSARSSFASLQALLLGGGEAQANGLERLLTQTIRCVTGERKIEEIKRLTHFLCPHAWRFVEAAVCGIADNEFHLEFIGRM